MEALQDLFPSRSERELQEVLDEASQSFDRALEILLERPAAPPPRPRPLQNLAKRVSNVIEAPPLTPATASALSFMNMTLSGDDDRQKGSPKAPQLPRQVITISDDEEAGKSPNIVAKAVSKGDSESETVAYILSIFPDVCPESTRELYKAHRYLQGSSVAEFLVDKYLEEGYVKAEKVGQKRKRKASDGEEASARKKDAYDPAGRPPSTQDYRRAVLVSVTSILET